MYGQRIDYLSPTLYITDILIGFLFVLSLIKKQVRIPLLFVLLILYLSFTVFLSQNPLAGWYTLLKFLEMSFVTWYVMSSLRKSTTVVKVTTGVVLAITVIFESLLSFIQFYLHSSVGGLLYFLGERTFSSETPGIANASVHGTLVLRPYGTFSHPNVLAGFLLIGMLVVWYVLYEEHRWWKRYVLFSMSLLGSAGILFTLSRTTLLVGLSIGLIFLLKKLNKRIIVASLGLLVFLVFLFPTIFYRFAPSTFEESAVVRERLFQASLSMTASHPFFGVGLGNFLSSLPSSMTIQPVHNIFFLWLSETGIIGAVIVLVFVFILSRQIIRTWQRSKTYERQQFLPLLFALCSLFILGMFDHYFLTLQQGQLLFALVIGLVLAHLNK